MKTEKKQQLMDFGVDVDGMLERFGGNEQIAEKFLKKFLQDLKYQAFQEALDEEAVSKAFGLAHELKGVCGNLSLMTLYENFSRQVEYLRAGNLNEAKEQAVVLEAEYKRVTNGLREVLG